MESLVLSYLFYCLQGLFVPFDITELLEVTLGANQFLNDATRLEWNVLNYGRTMRGLTLFCFLWGLIKLSYDICFIVVICGRVYVLLVATGETYM